MAYFYKQETESWTIKKTITFYFEMAVKKV
jgi:hypothetical protein